MTPRIDAAERLKIIGARIREGRDTVGSRLDAWHELGTVTGTWTNAAEMMVAAKATFSVVKQQLDLSGTPVDAWGTFRVDETIPNGLEKKVIPVTLPDGRQVYLTFLAPVGKDYEVIPHAEGLQLVDALIGEIEGAHYETMGTLDFGRLVWAQANPNIKISVGDDVSQVYLTFTTSHDGSKSAQVFETGTRMVCRNTYRIGLLNKLGSTLQVRHTKKAHQRMTDWKQELEEIRKVALAMEEKLIWLASRRMTRESAESVFDRLFPKTKIDDKGALMSTPYRDNVLSAILAKYEENDGDAFPEQRGTAYNLWNAVTNWSDHDRGGEENRARSAVFGSGATLKENALDAILKEAEGMPTLLSARQSIPVDFAAIGLNVKMN